MEQLPNHKIPQIGRPGERYRDVQIIRQLPKQDLSLEFCKMIGSSVEKKEYDIFRELRDSIAMDIGIVQEAPNLSVSLVHHGVPGFKKKHFRDPMKNLKISQFSVPVRNISLMDQSGLSGCVSAIY